MKVEPKKRARGRPRKADPIRSVVAVALSEALFDQLDQWMTEKGITSRSAAIRELVERGLGKKKK